MKKSKGKSKDLLLRVDHADILKEIARMGSCNPVNSCHHCRDWTQLIYKKQLLGKQQNLKQVKENSNYVTAGKYTIAIDSKDTFNRDLKQETEIPTTYNIKKEAATVLEPVLNNKPKSTTNTSTTTATSSFNHNTELLKQCISACEDWMVTPNQFSFLPPMFRQVDFEEEIADEHFDLIIDEDSTQQLKILKAVICDRQGVSLTIDQMALLKGMRKSHLKRVESDPTCCCDIKHDSPSNLQTEIDIINEKMKQALKEYLVLLNDKLITCWKPLNDFNIKILNMEKKLNDIVNDGLTERMDALIKKNNIVPFQDFWTPLIPGFKKKKSGVDVKIVNETFLGYLDQLTLAITDFYSQFVTTVMEELVQFNKEFSVFVLSAIENLMERVTNNTMIVNHLQEKGTKFDISKIKESCNIQNQTILKTAETIKKVVETKLNEHLVDVNEIRRIYSEESQPNVAARIEKVAHKDFRKKLKKVEHQYQTIRQNFRYELHKVLFEKDWFNDLAIASIQSLMKEGEACEACAINDTIVKFETKNNELIESKEELMDMFEHGITTGQHELDTVIGILLITEAYRLKYDNDAIKKQTLFLDSIGITSTTEESTSAKKKKKKGKSINATTTITTNTSTANDHPSEEVKEVKETSSSSPSAVASPIINNTKSSSAKSKKATSDKLEKQPTLNNETNSKKKEQTIPVKTPATSINTKLSITKVEETVTNKGISKKITGTSKNDNNNPSSSPNPNNSDAKKNEAVAALATKKASEKTTVNNVPGESVPIVKIEDLPVSKQTGDTTSEKVNESNNGWSETQSLSTADNNKQLASGIEKQTTTKEIRFSRKKKEDSSESQNNSQSTDKIGTTRHSSKNKKSVAHEPSKPTTSTPPSSSNELGVNNNNSSDWEQSQTSESIEKLSTTAAAVANTQAKMKNGWSSEWGEVFKNTNSVGWGLPSTNQSSNNDNSDNWGSVSTNQTSKNENSKWNDVSNEENTENNSSNGWISVGKNASKKVSTNTWSKPINKESKKDVSSGWDATNAMESTGWDTPKNNKIGGWDAPENTISSGWNTPKMKEPESTMFTHNNNKEMNYLGGWGSATQSKPDTLSYNNFNNNNNNDNNNNIIDNNNNNIPMNEPAVVNVSISDLIKSAEQDNYQGTQFPAPMEPNKTTTTATSPSIKPPPMIYPSFSTTLPIGNQSANVDQLHGMSSDSLITIIHSLRFENDQLKQSMTTLQQTVNMTLALAKEREEQTIQLFNSRKQADLEEARIYILSLEAKIKDLESQIRMQSSLPHNPTRTGFDNQDIFAGYREEMRVGSGRNTNNNDRHRQYNQRSGAGASSGGFGGGSGHPGRKFWQRTTIVKCSNCGESGHASSDCLDSCRYCNNRDHLSEQCPQHY